MLHTVRNMQLMCTLVVHWDLGNGLLCAGASEDISALAIYGQHLCGCSRFERVAQLENKLNSTLRKRTFAILHEGQIENKTIFFGERTIVFYF
jgi:hypothetical protein